MKIIPKEKILKNNLQRYVKTERNVLSIAQSNFIVKIHYSFQTSDRLFLILDFCPGGDLSSYLKCEKIFSEQKSKLYISEIILAIDHLHS